MIQLRKVELADYQLFKDMVENPALKEYWRRYGDPFSWLTPDTFLSNFALTFVIEDEQGIAGLVSLCNVDQQSRKAEFGAMVMPDRKGRGGLIATEGLKKLFDHAFNYAGLNKLYALVLPHREDIKHCLNKWGFRIEGTLKDNAYFDGKYHDELYFAITRSEFLERLNVLGK